MRTYKLYNLLCCIMVTVLLICNVLAFKTISIFGEQLAAIGLLFPLSFLIACVLTEVYGYSLAGRVIWIQLTCSVLFIFVINLVVLANHQTSGLDQYYFDIYHNLWKVVIACVIAIPSAYFATDWIMSRFKLNDFFGGIFPRYIFANIVGKFILVSISYPINFGEIYSAPAIIKLIINTWIFKVIAAILLSPIAWFVSSRVKKVEQIDTFDYGVSYNPLSVFNDDQLGENYYHGGKRTVKNTANY